MAWGGIHNPSGSKDRTGQSQDGNGQSQRQSISNSTLTETSVPYCNTRSSNARTSGDGSTQSIIPEKRSGSLASFVRRASVNAESCRRHALRISWRGCLAMLAGMFQQMLCWGMIMTFGTILAYYTDYLLPTTPKWQLTLVGTVPPFLLLILALIWGRLLDAGHHRKLNVIAGICLTGGLTGLAFTAGHGEMGSGRYWAILLAAVPMGVGQSIYFLAAPHMAKTWFPNNKGFAMGITNGGAALGGVAWPFCFTAMTSVMDFRLGVGALAAISLVLSVFITWAATTAPEFTRREVGEIWKFSTWVPTRAFGSRTFLFHIAAMCCIYLGILTVPFLIEVWAQRKHLGIAENSDENGNPIHFNGDGDMTVYIVVAMNACQLPGRLLGSTVCDYVKARKIHVVACVLAVIEVALAWNLTNSYLGACVFASFFGLILGIMVSLPINDAQEILGKNRTHLLGQYAGTVYTCASPFILAGGIVTGALVDRCSVKSAGIWTCATFGAGSILILVSLIIKDDTWKFDDDTSPQAEQCCQEQSFQEQDTEKGVQEVIQPRSDTRQASVDDAIMQATY